MILKIVNLLDPEMCKNCVFCSFGKLQGAINEDVIICRRGDCDNWETKKIEVYEVE